MRSDPRPLAARIRRVRFLPKGPGRAVRMPLMAAALLTAALTGCAKHGGEAEGQMPPTAVKLATVQIAEQRVTSEYLATLKSRRSLTLQPQIDGQVTQVLVTPGQLVEAGTPILQIDPARQAALVSSEQQTREAKQASLRYWREQTERLKALYDGGAVSLQELQQARTSLQSAQAEIAALGAQVQNQRVQLAYYRITAPARGIVGEIPVRVGDRVTPATVLTHIDNNDTLEAHVLVPAERAAELRPELPVELIGADGAVVAQTRVQFVSPLISEDTQAVLVKSLVDNQKHALRTGQLLRARIVWSAHKGPVVPVSSVSRQAGQHFVFVIEDKGGTLTARQRAVSVGDISGNDYAVTSGLTAGERVVLAGIQKLRDGATVRPEG